PFAPDHSAFLAHLPAGLGAEASRLGLAKGGAEPVSKRLGLARGPAPGRSDICKRGGAGAGFYCSRRRFPGCLLALLPQTPAADATGPRSRDTGEDRAAGGRGDPWPSRLHAPPLRTTRKRLL